MTKAQKIFISHHNSDAAALKLLKERLEPMGYQCFLAHDDIEPGEHDLNRIEEEVKNCDTLVYVCNKNSSGSVFCQQEIGMAKGLGKKIITVRTDESLPKGFIERIQAIRHNLTDAKFCEKIHWTLSRKQTVSEKIKKDLDFLGIKGFSRNHEKDTISVIDSDEKDDLGFRTTFRLRLNEDFVGFAKIGYEGQPYHTKTHDKLPSFFTHLDFPFFSYLSIDYKFTEKPGWARKLSLLLNDISLIPEAKKKEIVNEPVFTESLSRGIIFSGR